MMMIFGQVSFTQSFALTFIRFYFYGILLFFRLWRLSSKLIPDTYPYPLYKFGSAVHMKISEGGLMTVMVSADNVVYVYRALQEDTLLLDGSNVFSGTRYLRDKVMVVNVFYVPFQTRNRILEASYIDENDDLHENDLVWELESILHPYEKFGFTNFGYNLHSTGNLSLVSSYARDGSGEVGVYKRNFPSEGKVMIIIVVVAITIMMILT
jgi:hypothetical protein